MSAADDGLMNDLASSVVTVCKAEPSRDRVVPDRTIAITGQMPKFDNDNYVAEARAFHGRQAELIHGVLIAALPAGTLDHLFAVMAADRASILRVPRRPAEPEPIDDVIDVGVVGFEAQLRTAIAHQWAAIRALDNASDSPGERIAAARALLRYDLDAEPTDHVALAAQRAAVLAIHRPDEYGDCVHCHGDTGRAYEWPCPTAQALGVTA